MAVGTANIPHFTNGTLISALLNLAVAGKDSHTNCWSRDQRTTLQIKGFPFLDSSLTLGADGWLHGFIIFTIFLYSFMIFAFTLFLFPGR